MHSFTLFFHFVAKRKVNDEDGPPHPLIQPVSTGSDPLKRKPIESSHTKQVMLPPQNRFEESWRKGPPSPLPPLPPKPSSSPRIIERVANKIDERKVMVELGEPRMRMSRTFNDREAFDRMMAEEQRRKMSLQQEKMIENRPLPSIPQPAMYDDIVNSPGEVSSRSYSNPNTSTNPFERGPLDTPNERGRVVIEQQNPFVQQNQFSVQRQQQFQMQVAEEQDFHNRQNPFISRRDNFGRSSFDAPPHFLELKTDDYERLRRSRMDRCDSYVDMTNNSNKSKVIISQQILCFMPYSL